VTNCNAELQWWEITKVVFSNLKKYESWNIFTETEISRSKSNLSRCLEANLQTPHQNYGCYCNLLLWGRLVNSLKSVTEILPNFAEIRKSECIWVSLRGPDRETNEINLSCVEHNTTGHLVTHLVSFQYITCRVAAICTTYYSMLYFNFPRFEFQPFLKLFW